MEESQKTEFTSALEKPIQRTLSRWLYAAFEEKILSSYALIDHFKIVHLIPALSDEVRGKVLCTCNGGGDPKRAAKMNKDIVAATIDSMLKDKIITADDVCKEITTDHMVTVLSSQELYRLLFGKPNEKKRWLHQDKNKPASKKLMAACHRTILSERSLGEKTASAYLEAIGDGKIVHEKTPPRLLAAGQIAMIGKYRGGTLFTDDNFVEVYTPNELIDYVDLGDLFAPVEAVAKLNEWVEVPKPVQLPAAALDSIPPAEADQPPAAKAEDGDPDPEVRVERPSTEDVTLELDEDEDAKS